MLRGLLELRLEHLDILSKHKVGERHLQAEWNLAPTLFRTDLILAISLWAFSSRDLMWSLSFFKSSFSRRRDDCILSCCNLSSSRCFVRVAIADLLSAISLIFDASCVLRLSISCCKDNCTLVCVASRDEVQCKSLPSLKLG